MEEIRLELNKERKITVPSGEKWVNTKIQVREGEKYTFQAIGTWKDARINTDADGFSHWFLDLYGFIKRSPKNKWFALMGSINQGDSFLIGSTLPAKSMSSSGLLYCFANDAKGFYWNNSGSVDLVVRRVR